MATLSQSDRAPDPAHISTPITLKLPIHVQPEVIPTSYGCEVIVPILLKIPIVLQIDVSQKPPRCKPQAAQRNTSLAESVQASIESTSASLEGRSATPSNSDLPSSGSLSSSSLSSGSLSSASLSSGPSRSERFNSEPVSNKSESVPSATDIHDPSHQIHSKNLSKRRNKLHHVCPITVLAILLGSLLGAGCSSLLVKHLATLNVDQHCAIASTASTSLALEDRCF